MALCPTSGMVKSWTSLMYDWSDAEANARDFNICIELLLEPWIKTVLMLVDPIVVEVQIP